MSGSGKKRPPLVADKRQKKSKAAAKPRTTSRKRSASARRKTSRNPLVWLFRAIVRLIWGIGWRVTAVAGILVGLAVIYYAATLPPVGSLLDARVRGSVTLLDRNGTVFAWRGEQFGGQITAETVSPYLKDAIIATEDRRFYGHFGISPRGVASAVRINLSEGRGPLQGHGGSTITQQIAKLLCLGTEYDPNAGMTEAEFEADCRRTTLTRKLKEAVYSMAMELRYSKDEILTIYLNRAYLGAGTRGFEAAAQRYFGRSANELLPSEAAMLAGLLVAPTRYAPTANLQRSRDRANLIVGLMEDQGRLTKDEAAYARANPAQLSEAAEARAGGYFADWVMDLGPGFLTDETTEDVIIRTTFDQGIQTAAEEALQWVFDNKVRQGSEAQAAIVVMSADGAVRAMVGGRKFRGIAGQFNRAIQA
ncbi:MAG: penicillin-binding protein, partial [Boseongicola sp.]